MMTTYFRPGGLWRDIPADFEIAVRRFIRMFPARMKEYDALLKKNPIFLDRTRNIGILSAEDAINLSLTGPVLRGSGVAYDLRKAQPYSGYEQYEFDIPTGTHGDVYDRYLVRMEEMPNLRIIQ
jgi:NADH-quinone oxidoreductase subunit D